jgi:hypothetical protein
MLFNFSYPNRLQVRGYLKYPMFYKIDRIKTLYWTARRCGA